MLWKIGSPRFGDRLRQARGGDLEAFNSLVLDLQDSVYALALALLGDATAAEQETQAIFLGAFRDLAAFQSDANEKAAFRAWLLRRTLRRCCERLSTQRLTSDPSDADPCSRLRGLPLELRLPVALTDLGNFDYQEAAELLEIPLSVFRTRLAQGRCQLIGEVW